MSTTQNTGTNRAVNLLSSMVVVSLGETRLWTGRAKLKAEDLEVDEEALPPEALASLGSKRVISPDRIKPLQQIRYQMRRACLEVGTRFLGGFAVAEDEALALVHKLDKLVKSGEARAEKFFATFEADIRAWHEENPEWKHILSAGTPEKEKLRRRIGFGYQAYVVTTPGNESVAANLLGAVDMMGSSLVDEIVKEAGAYVKQSLKGGRNEGMQKTVDPVRRLGRKMVAVRFIDPTLGPMSKVVEGVLATIPTTGKVSGEAYMALTRVANLMADRRSLQATAKALFDGERTVESVVQQLTGGQIQTEVDLEDRSALGVETSHALGLESLFADAGRPESSSTRQETVDPSVAAAVALIQTQVNAPKAAPPQPAAVTRTIAIDF